MARRGAGVLLAVALGSGLALAGVRVSQVLAACSPAEPACAVVDHTAVSPGERVQVSEIQLRCDLAKPIEVDLLVRSGPTVAGTAPILDAHYEADAWAGSFVVPRWLVAGAGGYGLALRCSAPALEGSAPISVRWPVLLNVLAMPATDAAAPPLAPWRWVPVLLGFALLVAAHRARHLEVSQASRSGVNLCGGGKREA